MGHQTCSYHCRCLGTVDDVYTYDPWLCNVCIDFFKCNFAGRTDVSFVKRAAAELDGHVKKLRRYLERLEGKFSLKFSSFALKLRQKLRAKSFDALFFSGLVIPDHMSPEGDTGSVYGSAVSEVAARYQVSLRRVVRRLVPRGPQVIVI